jgi:type IV pilus assembly protein PilW
MIRSTLKNKTHAGFSLVELMIAMVIGLLMMTTAVQLFTGINRSSAEMANTNEQIENGRFSIQIMEEDVVHGGFWNGYVPQFDDLTATGAPGDIPSAIPDPCLAYASWTAAYKTQLLGIAVQTYDEVPTSCSAVITNKKANTDILVVRHADTCVPGDANCEADTSATTTPKVYFQANFCGTTTASAYDYVLATSGFTMKKRNCTTDAEKRKYVTHIYYISQDNVLMRAEFGGGGGTSWGDPKPLISGVESLVAELGIDSISDNGTNITSGATKPYTQAISWANSSVKNSPTNRGDGAPDQYVRCTTASPCTLDQLINVVAVKLYVLVRSSNITRGYIDTKTYTLGSTSISAPNDSYKRP